MTKQPVYARPDYATRYRQKVLKEERGASTWWVGTGIAPSAHPAAHLMPMNRYACAQCGFRPPWIQIIAANYTLSTSNGDECWAYEFKCDGCNAFNHLTFKG